MFTLPMAVVREVNFILPMTSRCDSNFAQLIECV